MAHGHSEVGTTRQRRGCKAKSKNESKDKEGHAAAAADVELEPVVGDGAAAADVGGDIAWDLQGLCRAKGCFAEAVLGPALVREVPSGSVPLLGVEIAESDKPALVRGGVGDGVVDGNSGLSAAVLRRLDGF